MTDTYVVLTNTNMETGKGFTILAETFATFDEAHWYIMDRPGIGGTEQCMYGFDKYGKMQYNGYELYHSTYPWPKNSWWVLLKRWAINEHKRWKLHRR